ncbi:Aminopeptidase N [Harpegnathos saltator]|uniref:Aminopeptidase N n=1 Tax=Harpegnathos saltator TaxID=610380 RepID=E2C143_HARSA|nr:Aminopeptidase N [Harpegnathos saltator]
MEHWIFVSAIGYYRVNYEYNNWVKIWKYLKEDHRKIHVLNRAQIIDDTYHFVMENEIGYETFENVISYLRKERDFIVWNSMMNILHYMSPFFNYPESKRFKEKMLKIMRHVLDKIEYDEQPEDDEMVRAMRLLLLDWSCKHGLAECRNNARYKLVAHFTDPKEHKILPKWKDWTYCAGFMSISDHEEILNVLYKPNKEILKYLICVDEDHLLQKLVELATFNPRDTWTEFKVAQLRKLYHGIVKKHAKKQKVLDFILSNFDKIVQGLSYVTTFEPRKGAQYLFPCWDEPRLKATFNISIEHSAIYKVFSNMEEEKIVKIGKDTKRTILKSTPVMSTYLLTIVLTKLKYSYYPEEEIWFSYTPNNETLELVKVINFLTDYFFVQYTQKYSDNSKLKKLNMKNSTIVAVPGLPLKAMGAWQNIFLRKSDLLYDKSVDFPGRVLDIWKTISYGKTRQYIQSFVSPNHWSHMWFSRALALYLSYNVLGKGFNKEQMMQLFVVQVQLPAMHNDIVLKVPPILSTDDPIYSTLIYKKDKWPVPVTYTTQGKHRFNQPASIQWLNNHYTGWNSFLELTLDNVTEWVILNLQQIGYYRVQYDNRNWLRIARFLKKDKQKTIHVLSRVQLIDDAYYFLIQGTIDYKVYCELIDFLRNEIDFIVWHSMMNVLHYISPFFKFPESTDFKDLIMDIMDDVLMQIEYNEKTADDNMIKATRLLLLNWMCNHGHNKCRQAASNKLRPYIKNAVESPISPGWKNWVYCAGLMNADYELRMLAKDEILNKKDKNMLQYMTCYDNDVWIQELLTWIMFKPRDEKLSLDDRQEMDLYRTIVKKHARKSNVLDFILKNMTQILPG